MKKPYIAPTAEKIEFHYSQQVVASAGDSCWWQNNGYWSHGSMGCQEKYQNGSGVQVPA